MHRRCFFFQVRVGDTPQSVGSPSQLYFSLDFPLLFSPSASVLGTHPPWNTQDDPAHRDFGEILETHQRGHPTLLSSHTQRTNGVSWFRLLTCVDAVNPWESDLLIEFWMASVYDTWPRIEDQLPEPDQSTGACEASAAATFRITT